MTILQDLEGFVFHSPDALDVLSSYLYKINEVGCTTVPDSFRITRDATYRYYVMHYVYGGSGILSVNDQHYKLQSGDFFILGPGKPHIYASDESNNLQVIWLEFHGGNTTELMHILLSRDIHLLRKGYTPFIAQKLIDLLVYLRNASSITPFDVAEKMYSILLSTIEWGLKSYEENGKLESMELPLHIQKSIQFINSELHSSIKISDLAELVNCSPSYLSKSFSSYMGISPYKYILIKKIEYAIVRIHTEGATATQLAEELGFVDTTHFTKVFKKITGKKISEYKKLVN